MNKETSFRLLLRIMPLLMVLVGLHGCETNTSLLKDALSINDPTKRSLAVSGVAIKQAEEGSNVAARETARKIENHSIAIQTLVNIESLAGNYSKAILLSQDIHNSKVRNAMRLIIIRKQAESGEFELAIRNTEKLLLNSTSRMMAFSEIAQNQAKAGRLVSSFQTASKVKANNQVTILTEVAEALAGVNKTQAALKTLERALLVTHRLDPETYQKWTLSDIAVTYAEIGAYSKAHETVEKIKTDLDRDHTRELIVIVQIKSGDLNSALDTINKISRPFMQSEPQRHVAYAYAKNGDYSSALDIARANKGIWRDQSLFGIAMIQKKQGDYLAAIDTAKLIGNYLHDGALIWIIRSLVEDGEFDSAQQTKKLIKGQKGHSEALHYIEMKQNN